MKKLTDYDDEYVDDVQRWAVEQIIKLHPASGMTPEEVIRQAKILVNYVVTGDAKVGG